jgi:hypothetical protein
MHVALLVILRTAGPDAVRRARAAVAGAVDRPPTRRSRRRRTAAPRPANRELDAPDDIELEPIRPVEAGGWTLQP